MPEERSYMYQVYFKMAPNPIIYLVLVCRRTKGLEASSTLYKSLCIMNVLNTVYCTCYRKGARRSVERSDIKTATR